MDTPFTALHVAEVGSTQHLARVRYAGIPLLVTTDRQSAGKGRLGKEWVPAARAVAASLAFVPRWPVARWPLLTLSAGLAARRALGDRVLLKWPNDLVVGDLKVGGLLAEADPGLVVIGLGVNLFWPDPIEGAAGLLGSDPGPTEPRRVARSWAEHLLSVADGDAGNWGHHAYAAVCVTLGRRVTWEPSGRGLAVAVTADGGLEVETDAGPAVLRSGEVHTLRQV
jgi:BirA family biotin operon repressor/biotin-[acetyl-CoA-carboxylase] ligase